MVWEYYKYTSLHLKNLEGLGSKVRWFLFERLQWVFNVKEGRDGILVRSLDVFFLGLSDIP